MIILGHVTATGSPEFLHMSTNSQKQTDMNTECSDIGSSLTGNSEHTQSLFRVKIDQL